MKRFTGIFTPIITPFKSDDTLDEAGLRRNVARWMETSLTGLVVLGSNGEAAQLDDAEADRIVDIVRGDVPSNRPLIAGTGRESTRATIEATRRAACCRRRCGARANAVVLQVADDDRRVCSPLHRCRGGVARSRDALQRDDVHGSESAARRCRAIWQHIRTSSG